MLWILLFAIAWLHWADTRAPVSVQNRLRAWTDFGSRRICYVPGMSNICSLVCIWDDYSSLFPSVCLAEDLSDSVDNLMRDADQNFLQAKRLHNKLLSTPVELRKQRNTIILHLYYIEATHKKGEIKEVDFGSLERSMRTVLDLMDDFPTDIFKLLYDVRSNLNMMLIEYDEHSKTLDGGILKGKSTTYKSKYNTRCIAEQQERLLTRYYNQEWKLMVNEMVEASKPIKLRLNELENESLSLCSLVKTAVDSLMDQTDRTIRPWSLLKRLGLYYGLIVTPREIQDLLIALDQFNELDALGFWNNTMSTNTNLDKMMEVILKGNESLYALEYNEEEQSPWYCYWPWQVLFILE